MTAEVQPVARPPFDAGIVMPGDAPYASPAIRAFARELGVDIRQVKGSGRGGRIQREDVTGYVKHALASGARPTGAPVAAGGGLNLLPWPKVDFSKFGEIEEKPLSRIQKISGANLARNWAMIPHVTQFDDADVTELEALRVAINKENAAADKSGAGIKLTMLAFLIKAVVAALKKYPDFNASLDASGENLTLKKYFNVGFAADTPNGLVVPVLKDADKKGIIEIAQETGDLAKKARDGKLGPAAPAQVELAASGGGPASPAKGREVYERNCRLCHGANGGGGTAGPDLTHLTDASAVRGIVSNGRDQMPAFGSRLSADEIRE